MSSIPLIFMILIAGSKQENVPKKHESNDPRINCLLNIFNKYLNNHENIVVCLRNNSNEIKDTKLIEIMNNELNWSIYEVQSEKNPTNMKLNNTIDSYLIGTFRGRDIEHDLRFLRSNIWEPQAKFIIVSNATENKESTLENVFKKLWEYKVINSIVLLPEDATNQVFEIYTWYPYRRGNCGKYNESVLLDVCQNGEMKHAKKLFPEKIPRNLNKCPIRIKTVIWPPYVIAPKRFRTSSIGINFTEGIEIQLMNTLAKAMNFKTVYTVSNKSEDWGYVYDNGTTTGIFKSVTDDEVDIAMSSLAATVNRYKYLDPSIPYTTESLTWCVPSAILKPKWLNVFNIFDILTWVNVYITFIFIVTVSIVVAKLSDEPNLYKNPGNCIINMFAVFNGLSLQRKPTNVPLRIIFWLCAFFNLIISAVYQTSLISFLTEPAYEKQMKTVEEIFDEKLNFFILPASIMYFAWDVDDWKSQKILKEMVPCQVTAECLEYIAHHRNFSMATPRLFVLYISDRFVNKDGHSLVYWFKEDMMSFPVQMFMSRGFPLRKRMNSQITQILQTGILDKWQKDLKYMLKEKESVTENPGNDNEKDPQILTLTQLQGAFIILLIGVVISGLVFTIEIIYSRYKKRRQ